MEAVGRVRQIVCDELLIKVMKLPFTTISAALEHDLGDANPWWRGEKIAQIPKIRRWPFVTIHRRITDGLAAITVVRGPRQVGKTTLMIQIIDKLLGDGVNPKCICRVQFDNIKILKMMDEPILDIARWFAENILQKSYNQAALDNEPAYLFFDEIQIIPDWAAQLKHLVDIQPVRVFITDISALKIEAGRDSLAGRMSTLEMGPLLLREIAGFRHLGEIQPLLGENGLETLKNKEFWLELRAFGYLNRDLRDASFAALSERGAFPIAQHRIDRPWLEMADHLVESIIQRVIVHDLSQSPRGRKRDTRLLEEVFRLSCRYIGQSPTQAYYVNEIKRVTTGNVGWNKVLSYLKFLNGSLLLKLIEPLEIRLKRRRGAAKLCLCDHALRAAWFQEKIPLTETELDANPHLSDLAGRVAESIAGYFLGSIPTLDIAHFPERGAEPEVDYILTIGEHRIPLEVKYRKHIEFTDTRGLRSFIEKSHYNAPFGILVTLNDEITVDDPRIVCLPLGTLLLMR